MVKYTLITGASSGIGKSIAGYCGSLGMNLILVSLPDEGLEQVALTLAEKHKVRTVFYETDLSLLDSPGEIFNRTQADGLQVNILINNAGVAGASVFENSELKYIDDRILLNVRALVVLSRLFLPELCKHKESHILNVSSMAAFFPIPYKSLYSASKAFVLYFSQAISSELEDSCVNISVLCPNGVRTNGNTHGRINAHGRIGRWTEYSSEEVARCAVDGMLKNKFLIIPGNLNYFLLALRRIIPPSLQRKLLAREFKKEIAASCN